MPDFTFKQNFPMAEVINAAQRKAAMEQEAKQQGDAQFVKGLESIGKIGQSMVDKKLQVAQALALGKQFGIPDEQARLMHPDQVLKVAAVNKGQIDSEVLGAWLNRLNGGAPTMTGTPATAPAAKPKAATPAPQAPAPAASAVMPSPMAAPGAPAPLPGPTTGQMPVPIAAPPPRMVNKATADLAMKTAMATRMQPVMTQQAGLEAGAVPLGTHLVSPKGGDEGTSSDRVQQKLEKEYTALKARALSSRSGGLGLENMKVDQAIHLRQSINQRYDPKTGTYNIPPSLHAEYVIGLARLMSPGGVVAVQTMDELRQKTAREGVANTLIAMGFNPEEVGGTTQSVARFFVHQIDRQGEVAEDNRQGYMDYIHGQAPVDLDPKRIEAHDKKGLNSFKALLSKSPDFIQQQQPSGGGLSADEAAEMQALESKLKAKGKL